MPKQNDGTNEVVDAHKKTRKAAGPKQPQAKAELKPAAPEVEAAATVFRKFKKKHRRFFEEHPKEAAAIAQKAFRRVFGQKPGPKTHPNTVKAGRARAAGSDWRSLYPKYIEGHDTMSEFTRSLAEAGFQKKVNSYIARNPRLAARRKKSLAKLRPQLPAG